MKKLSIVMSAVMAVNVVAGIGMSSLEKTYAGEKVEASSYNHDDKANLNLSASSLNNTDSKNYVYPEKQLVIPLDEFKKNKSNFMGENVILDKNLRFMINYRYENGNSDEELYNNNVTKEMVENLVVLSPEQCMAHNRGEESFLIKSLKGLEYAKNLEYLSLVNQQPDSLEPIKDCVKLRFLDVRNNNVLKDILPIKKLVNLEELDIRNVKVGDISALANLVKMRRLIAFGCGINDLTPLKNLVKMEFLQLEYNGFTDISALSNMVELRYLDISKGNKFNYFTQEKNPTVKSISDLKNLTKLETLSFTNNDVEDISVLKNMKGLKRLFVNNNLIRDWSAIKNIETAEFFYSGNPTSPEINNEKPDEKNILEVMNVINPRDIQVDSKEKIRTFLPKTVDIRTKKFDKTYRFLPGVFNKSTLRYKVVDTEGNPIFEDLTFDAVVVDSSGNTINTDSDLGHYGVKMKGGYLDILGRDVSKFIELKLELKNKDYELVGDYGIQEGPCPDGFFIKKVSKKIEEKVDSYSLVDNKPENKSTFDIPVDKNDIFTVVVKKNTPAQPDTEENLKGYVKKSGRDQEIRYVLRDENGKLIKDALNFKVGNEKIVSKDGFLSIILDGVERDVNISLNDEKYELVGEYGFVEGYSIDGRHLERLDKNNKRIVPGEIKNGEYEISDKDVLDITLREKKAEIPAKPQIPNGEDDKRYIKDDEVNFVIKDEDGNILNREMNFKFVTDFDEISSKSQNGYLKFKAEDDYRYEIELSDDEYEMINRQYVDSGYKKLLGVVKEYEGIMLKDLYEKNSDGTYVLPKDKKDILVINVSKKANSKEEYEFRSAFNMNGIKTNSLKENESKISSSNRNETEILNKERLSKQNLSDEDILKDIGVTWRLNKNGSDEKRGRYVFEGDLDLGNNIKNPHGITARAIVNVVKKSEKPKGDSSSGSYSPTIDNKKERAIEQLSGYDRYLTSVELSKKFYKKAETVILVSGENYADALVSSSLSAALKAPIILTNGKSLNIETKDELKRLACKNIIIIGGRNSMSENIENDIKNDYTVERIFGSDRYETSEKIYEKLDSLKKIGEKLVIASGQNYADALSAGNISTDGANPILLVNKDDVSAGVIKKARSEKTKEVLVVGGEASVSKGIDDKLGKKYIRLNGNDRYETSAEVARYQYKNSKEAFITSGQVFADAMSVSGVLPVVKIPLVLTKKSESPLSIKRFLKDIDKIIIVGGSESVEKSQFER